MAISISPSEQSCGAQVGGVDLTLDLDAATVQEIREAWVTHQVLSFPNQHLKPGDLERFTSHFGPRGDDPFITAIPGRPHVIALHRAADETASVFAENWHTDWSFQVNPPDGTCLYSLTIPPVGGNTEFANQYAAYEQMPGDLRARTEGAIAIHSARSSYAPDGLYGADDEERATAITYDESAMNTQRHPLIQTHSETGRRSIFSCAGYIIGIEGLSRQDSDQLLGDVYRWQTRREFVYAHEWQANTLVMWDNRSLLHRARAGYDGHERLLHRTTIGHNPVFA